MNRKGKAAVALFVLLLAVLAIMLPGRRGGGVGAKPQPGTGDEAGQAETKPTDAAGRPLPDDEGLEKPADLSKADWQRFLRLHAARKASNQTIRFYGKVIDQNGDPVPDVQISAEITRREESLARVVAEGEDQITEKVDFFTDSKGMFVVDERKGYAFGIDDFKREGYERPGRGVNTLFMFGQLLRNPASDEFHHPDSAHPVVFTMWKKGVSEPLVAMGAKFSFLQKDGIDTLYMPLALDAKPQPKPVVGWDIKIKAKVNSRDEWSVTLEGSDGSGFVVTDDVHTKLAPESGYQPSITVSSSDPVDPSVAHRNRTIKVYFRGKDGNKYATFRMEFGTWGQKKENNLTIELLGVRINPNGSRNLEFDRSKQIK